MLTFSPTHAAEIFESPEGRVVLWFPASGLAAGRCIGHVTTEIARQVYALIDAQPLTPHEGFIDFVETTGFDWGARGCALKWNILHLSPKMHLHMLVATAPMLLASRVFERTLGEHVELHTDPATFASAYSLAVKRRTRAGNTEPPRR